MSEFNKDGSFVLDTPEDIDMYRWLTVRRGLKLKLDTGMELTRGMSCLKAAKLHGYTDKGTAAGAFKQMNEWGELHGIEPLTLREK